MRWASVHRTVAVWVDGMARLSTLRPSIGGLAPRIAPPPKIADSFYHSPEWKSLVREIKQERGAWCQRCGSTHRLIGDHIVEIKDGGAKLDKNNVELLCHAHHQQKTAQARAARARGEVHGRGVVKSSQG